MSINNLTVSGNVGRDPELRYIPSGTAVTDFPLATKSGWGEKEKTSWVKCTLWGKMAESLVPFIKKGSKLVVSGEFSASEWTTQEGEKRTTVEINVRDLELQSKNSNGGTDSSPQQNVPATGSNNEESSNDFDDDIPW